jgi:hypothetical protein
MFSRMTANRYQFRVEAVFSGWADDQTKFRNQEVLLAERSIKQIQDPLVFSGKSDNGMISIS